MDYITSDLHVFHKNILKFNPDTRPFNDTTEMREYLVKHWNDTVNPEDTIYHLGDISFGSPEKTTEFLCRLNGNKIFIKGNHDTPQIVKVLRSFGSVYDYKEIKHNGEHIVLMHYPIHHWNRQHHGSLHFFGHCHGSFKGIGKSIDVGYDAHGRILSIDEAILLAKNKPQVGYKDKE